jgi:integrase
MRRRHQKGSLQKRKRATGWAWIGMWRDVHGRRLSRNLGKYPVVSKAEAQARLEGAMAEVNQGAEISPETTFGDFVRNVHLPFCRRKWKASTASTSVQRINFHLISEFDSIELRKMRRDPLQDFLDQKARSGLSFSVVDHLRWDLRAICELAIEEGLIARNPAKSLYTPNTVAQASKRVMTEGEVTKCLLVLDLRERLIARLAIFAGMRPGEIFGLKWEQVKGDSAEIVQRVYKGTIDSPKTRRSVRTAAFTPKVIAEIEAWRQESVDATNGWVFPSERLITPLSKDNCWRRHFEPRLRSVGLKWVNFQVMRRTHSSLSRRLGVDPKTVADQLGHGIGVNLDVYTQSGLEAQRLAVTQLEEQIFSLSGVQRSTDLKWVS